MQKLTRSVHHVPARFVPGVIGASHLSTGSAALVEQHACRVLLLVPGTSRDDVNIGEAETLKSRLTGIMMATRDEVDVAVSCSKVEVRGDPQDVSPC